MPALGPVEAVLQGVFTQFSTNAATNGYLYYAGYIPQTEPATLPPYVVGSVLQVPHDHTWGSEFNLCNVVFDCWSNSKGIGEIAAMMDAVILAFAEIKFPVPGYMMVMSKRLRVTGPLIDPTTYWFHAICEFEVTLQQDVS